MWKVLLSFAAGVAGLKSEIEAQLHLVNFDLTNLYQKLIANDRRNMGPSKYIGHKRLQELMAEFTDEYPELFQIVKVQNDQRDRFAGSHGYQTVVKMGGIAGKEAEQSSILIDGAHHSRELTSVQMVCYYMLRILYEYELELKGYTMGNLKEFFREHAIYFIPVVNEDGYLQINDYWR